MIEQGPNWNITLIAFSLGFLYSSYLVFLETEREKEIITTRLNGFEKRQPEIVVGFLDQSGGLTQDLYFKLERIPPKPDVDSLVEEKRIELLRRFNTQVRLHRLE